jgi:hypothetical protein
MAMDLLTMRMFDQFVVVLNNFHMDYEIGYLMLDIDDDDNQLMTYKHYMLMDQMLMVDLLLMLFLIELYH